jgi:hypothetical protein
MQARANINFMANKRLVPQVSSALVAPFATLNYNKDGAAMPLAINLHGVATAYPTPPVLAPLHKP